MPPDGVLPARCIKLRAEQETGARGRICVVYGRFALDREPPFSCWSETEELGDDVANGGLDRVSKHMLRCLVYRGTQVFLVPKGNRSCCGRNFHKILIGLFSGSWNVATMDAVRFDNVSGGLITDGNL